jgi:hypothetical protein
MNSPIKKLPGKVASFLKQIPRINFKSEQEIINAYEQRKDNAWANYQYRHKRFDYYFTLFGLQEGSPFDDLTDKQAEQYSLLWKLVDLEGGRHE